MFFSLYILFLVRAVSYCRILHYGFNFKIYTCSCKDAKIIFFVFHNTICFIFINNFIFQILLIWISLWEIKNYVLVFKELTNIQKLISTKKKYSYYIDFNHSGRCYWGSLGLKHFLNNNGIDAEVIVLMIFQISQMDANAKKIIVAEYKKKLAFEMIQRRRMLFLFGFQYLFSYRDFRRLG